MKLLPAFALASALLLAGTTAQAQMKVKTKAKTDAGTTLKTKGQAQSVTLDGPIRRIETVSGIDIFPKPNSPSIMLSFTQQFTQPGRLTMKNYKDQIVYQQVLDPATSLGQPVDLGKIPAGTYLVEATTGNYVYWKKVRVKYPTTRRR